MGPKSDVEVSSSMPQGVNGSAILCLCSNNSTVHKLISIRLGCEHYYRSVASEIILRLPLWVIVDFNGTKRR